MIAKLLANPYAGDGTLHPDMHLIYVDEVCGLFKLAGMPEDVIKKKVFPLYLKGEALTWYRLCDTKRIRPSCYTLFTFPLLLLQSLQNPKILPLLLLPLLPYYFATKYFAADTKLSRCG